MGKNKLKKFAEMETLPCVYQYPYSEIRDAGEFPMRGRWAAEAFHNQAPLTLELGCGKGEYAVGMGTLYP
ncbi:MAG: tRNA (guanosine(46)-N7)-methyltransferase TrmB, partial [Duncaniella sp.]|nr:tRNA (guanosine(46)-N7)-methyltransferase TrmB [Duncaniella sp.]